MPNSITYGQWLHELLAGIQDQKYAYLIEMRKNKGIWFFQDMKEHKTYPSSTLQLIWTPSQKKATMFETEEMVEEFKSRFISPRKTSIIRVTYDLNFFIGG